MLAFVRLCLGSWLLSELLMWWQQVYLRSREDWWKSGYSPAESKIVSG